MKKLILFLVVLFPLVAYTIGLNVRTINTEVISTKKDNQDITISPSGTGNVVLKDYSGFLFWSSGSPSEQANVDATEFGYLDGVTSPIQTQLDNKLESFTLNGTANEIEVTGGDTVGLADDAVLPGQGAVTVPVGNTAARPSSPMAGMLRYNSDEGFEGFNGTEWGAIAGAGGAAGVLNNFLECPSFENCDQEGSITTSGSDTSAIATRTVEATAFNENKLVLSASGNATLDYTYTKSANFEGQQLYAYCEIKTANTDVTFNSMLNGAVDSTLDVVSDDKWRYYRIPLLGGVTSQGFKIDHTNASETPDIDVDNCFIGKTQDASFKIDTTISDSIDYTPTIIGIGTGTVTGVEGSWSRIGDKMIIQVAFNMATNGSAGGNVGATLPAGYEIDTTKLKYDSGNTASIGTTYFTGDTRLNNALSISSLPTNIYTQTAGSSATAGSRFSMQAVVPIVGWSSEKSTVVTQETELTAKTANELSAKIINTGAVTSENYEGFLDASCQKTAGTGFVQYVCDFESGVFTQAPACFANDGASTNSQNVCGVVEALTTTSTVTIRCNQQSTTGALSTLDRNFPLHCSKQGADVNKSATIVGKFENINSSELVRVKAEGNNNDVLTGGVTDIVFSEEVEDVYNAWDGSGFTAPKTANYLVTGMMRFTTSATTQAVVYIDGVSTNTRFSYSPSDATLSFVGQVTLTQGQRLSLREPFARTLFDSEDYHHIEIQELPDSESIVKNLLAESSQTKCQTKILTGDITSTGSYVNDLKFTNLKAGRFYKLFFQAQLVTDTATFVSVEIFNADNALTNQIGRVRQSTNTGTNISTTRSDTYVFKNLSNAVSFYYTESGSNQRLAGNSSKNETFATLCEMPETFVETTEW